MKVFLLSWKLLILPVMWSQRKTTQPVCLARRKRNWEWSERVKTLNTLMSFWKKSFNRLITDEAHSFCFRSWSTVSVSRGLKWWGRCLTLLLGLIWSTSDSHLYMLNFCLSPGVLPNITQVLLPLWHPKVSTFLLLSLVVSSAHPPLTTFVCTEWGMEWPCSILLLSWQTWREARGSASAASPTSRAPAFACSGAFPWGKCEGNSHARLSFSPFSMPVIAVIFHGSRCFTNFSTTWPITSPKDRWAGITCVIPHFLMPIIMAVVSHHQQTNEMKVLLAALYKQPVPLSPGCVTLQMVNLW